MTDGKPVAKARGKTSGQTPPLLPVRIARAHPRLFTCAALGCAMYVLLTLFATSIVLITRLLIAWDFGVLCYLAAAAWMMARSPVERIRHHAATQDEGAFGLLVLTVGVAIASLAAIFAELASVERSQQHYWAHVGLAVVTIILSWAFTHTIYALHYAYEYYGEGERSEGLNFPNDKRPDYWDFVYFSFVIGMTYQVSDVAVTNKWIRRTVVAHGAVSFLFSTAILALMVNMAATLIGAGK